MRKLTFSVMAIMLMLAASTALAVAKEPQQMIAKVTIKGPGLNSVVEITDYRLLGEFESAIAVFYVKAIEPPQVGEEYELTSFYKDGNGQLYPVERLRYYVNPTGGAGYIFYIGGAVILDLICFGNLSGLHPQGRSR